MLHSRHAARRITSLRAPKNARSIPCSSFSSGQVNRAYEDTIQNLKIGKDTRVIYQGFTGKVSTTNAQQSLDWGTNIVGGTTPGKEGEHLGLPLLPSVQKAADQLKPHASAVFVAAHQAGKAIEDAIAAEIPLIVTVAEFIPLHDVLRIAAILKTQSKSRVVGANSPGIIAPLGFCRIGFQPLPCYAPGHIGVIAKSGTLSYEAVGSLTKEGLGQSLCIGMGGDIVAGTNLVDGLKLFESDPDTEAIVVAGEIGGRAELDAAEWIKDYKKRVKNPKPIVAAVGGVRAPPGRIMGHAGAFASLGEVTSDVKIKALQDAGVTVVNHPAKFGPALKQELQDSGRDLKKIMATANQKRGYHTSARRLPGLSQQMHRPMMPRRNTLPLTQQRNLHVTPDQAKKLLQDAGIQTANESNGGDQCTLAITVNRTERCPAIFASPTTDPNALFQRGKLFDYDYLKGPDDATINAAIEQLQLAKAPSARSTAANLLKTLVDMFAKKEAYLLQTSLSATSDGNLQVEHAEFAFDDSAFKSGKRQEDIQALRQKEKEDPDEIEAEKDGIVYIKLKDPAANIGTLINGAGLAMNANDALFDEGARPTNFLDTGGKATSATVKKCFELLLRDERVKVIFVNIFGGLTLCDMIAEGIMMAFKDLDMKIPIVVRLRGTNEAEGQKMIRESGLPLHAHDDFEEAAKKCIELANK